MSCYRCHAQKKKKKRQRDRDITYSLITWPVHTMCDTVEKLNHSSYYSYIDKDKAKG